MMADAGGFERRPDVMETKAVRQWTGNSRMQNAECSRGVLRARVRVLVCILHSAFCIAQRPRNCSQACRARWATRPASSPRTCPAAQGGHVPAAAERAAAARRVLKDESGRDVRSATTCGKKPVVLAFVYYQCPMLCPLVMNGISSSLRRRCRLRQARTSRSCSSASIRAIRRRTATGRSARISRTGTPRHRAGWHFLTGDEARSIAA